MGDGLERRIADLEERIRQLVGVRRADADKIQGRHISSAQPAATQVIGWNNITKKWEPVAPGGAGVTFAAPTGAIDMSDLATEGVSTSAARADHQHEVIALRKGLASSRPETGLVGGEIWFSTDLSDLFIRTTQ